MSFSFLSSCAVNGVLTGGPKDIEAPELIEEKSEKPGATRFNKKELIFEFNENIEIKNAIKQVVISPPLKFLPQIKSRAKKLIFAFNDEEVLKDNTTYVVNFGETIQDLNEQNKLINFKYVFSTGDQIDSLSVSGNVLASSTGKGIENIVVLLYDNLSDSAIVKEKPFYFTKTDKDGKYLIENIKQDTFRLFAIQDNNTNYTWNEATENIAFYDSLLLWVDTTKLSKNLSMSAADITPRVLSRDDKNFGVIKLKLSRPMETVPIVSSIEPTDFKTFSRIKGDSLIINYYTQADSFIISLYNDTLKMLVPSAREFKDTLRIQSNFIIPAFNPYDSLTFILSNPATTFDATKIIITDSLNRPIMVSPKTDKTGRNLSLHGELPRRSKLQIRFLPNAITDIYGDGNSLTEMNVKTVGDENLGNVRLFIENLDSTKSYIVNFMQAQRIMKVIHIKGKSSLMWEVSRLLPEVFRVQIIEDENRNGVWDSTRYWQKKQAEKIINRELEKLRENWTMETKIFWE